MTIIAIIFGVILCLVLFAEPIFNLLDFLLGIIEGILDIFNDICYFIGNIFDKGKRTKNHLQIKKAEHDYQVLEQKRKQQQKELQNFQSVEELPNDSILLERLYHDFKSRGDQKRGFICLNKAVSLGSHMDNEFSLLYLAGIGTDENMELAKKYQLQYFKREIKSDEDISKWEAWCKGDNCFADFEGMREVAENLIENKNILGIFLLDHEKIIEKFFSANSPDKRKEIYEKYQFHPYFVYTLSLLQKDDQDLLKRAAYSGCYLAAVKINHQDMINVLKEYANQLIKQDHFDYHTHQTTPFVDLTSIYNKAYQGYLGAYSLSERLPYYEVIVKLASVGFSQAYHNILDEASKLADKDVKSLDEIKFAYLTILGVFHTYEMAMEIAEDRERFEALDAMLLLVKNVIKVSNEQHYDDYLKKSVELCIDMISVEDLKIEKYFRYYLIAIEAYISLLERNGNKSYNKDTILKKGIDKLEQSYSGGLNGMIEKYRSKRSESEVDEAIFSLLLWIRKYAK